MEKPRYKTDLTNSQWLIISKLIPPAKEGGRPRSTDMREVINTIFYALRTSCGWDYLPTCFPAKSTVYENYSVIISNDATIPENRVDMG